MNKKPAEIFHESLEATWGNLEWLNLPRLSTGTTRPGRAVWLKATAQDIISALGWTGGKIVGKRARTAYLVLALLGSLAGVATLYSLGTNTLTLYAGDLRSPSALVNRNNIGTVILDRHGQVLYEAYGASQRREAALEELPEDLLEATLAAEDPNFYHHPGFSWKSTLRALANNLRTGESDQGGSTITQQLVKNALLSPEKKMIRKFKEIVLSVEIERLYDKNQILSMYLNKIYYGQGSIGVEAAAQTYFHKPARDLTLSESALLAGLPLAPSLLDPNLDPAAAAARRNFILDRMRQFDFISKVEAETAKAEPIQAFGRQVALRAPHFVFYVLEQLRAKYGADLVERGGLTVYTTLDLGHQQAAENIARAHIDRLRHQHVSNAGLVSIDTDSGEILSMLGSVDFFNDSFGRVNTTLARFQPGSAFKPFAYVTAFKKGWNGATVVEDEPIAIPNFDGTVYRPRNYDGTFRGQVTLRRALANSLNIPAVKVLRYAGIRDTIQTARELGITGLDDENRYGLSLVLGGAEVRPIDMAGAYATFANQGIKVEPQAILKVLDRRGEDITELPTEKQPAKPVIDPRLAYMILHILSDNQARAEIFGPRSPLVLSGRAAAVKTGTTNDFRDNWSVGSTPQTTTAVWVGNNDHTPMTGVSGISGAALIWHDYMETILRGQQAQEFTRPAGLTEASVCLADGGLANPWDRAVGELFLAESLPTRRCASPKPEEPKPEIEPAALRGEKPDNQADDENPLGLPPGARGLES